METMVGVEGHDGGKFEEVGAEKFCAIATLPKQISDSVVYKLVRVEGDGRLVPATDEEVMEVVDLLENDKTAEHIADSGQTVGCISNDGSSSGKSLLESSDGLSQRTNPEVDAGRFKARLEGNGKNLLCTITGTTPLQEGDVYFVNGKKETLPSLSPNVNERHIYQSGSLGECSNPPSEPTEYGSSPSSDRPSQKPDFSKLEGEICLDNLTIRELQDTFRATFGRETTVKDKMWLKRRIAMGLSNSCEVSTMTFNYKDNTVAMKGEEESCKNMDHSSIMVPEYMDDDQTVSGKRLRSYNEYACGGEDVQNEPMTTKRVRKPTKRYIEELSESDSVEHGGRLLAASRCPIQGQISPRSAVRLVKNVSSDGRTVITRLDSLGGSGVQIPYVSRIRRSRPRKNIMALMRFHPSGTGMDAELVKKAASMSSSQSADENESIVVKAGYDTGPIEQPIDAEAENKPNSVAGKIEIEQNADPKHLDSSGETSDDNIATVPTAKGGMRRKHHRAWTLSEVMKLVEGVARYGAGRWSEIKRLAFASYSHRTSVDLKDKWRNLLKASFAQTPPDKAINSRKQASMSIPEPILIRVRELAEVHAQGLPNLGPNKIGNGGSGGRSLHDAKSGFL